MKAVQLGDRRQVLATYAGRFGWLAAPCVESRRRAPSSRITPSAASWTSALGAGIAMRSVVAYASRSDSRLRRPDANTTSITSSERLVLNPAEVIPLLLAQLRRGSRAAESVPAAPRRRGRASCPALFAESSTARPE